jgi:peptidoglycan/xylan/chitin deacetylase (PgdA/CDA1 family)
MGRSIRALLLGAAVLGQSTWAAAPPARPGLDISARVLTSQRVVALTFDDGPSPYTAQILAILHAFRAHATFFAIGRQVIQDPAMVRAEVSAGDEVGNHTYSHANLLYLSNLGIRTQLLQTQEVIHAAAGISPVWFRPPDGAIDSRVAAVAASLGLRPILWSVDPRDWSRPGTSAIIQRVLAAVRPGSVVLLHDGGGDRSQTVAALSVILRALQAEGYRILTVSGLFHPPSVPACNQTRAAHWFAAAGISPLPRHAIDRIWFQSYCLGRNFGPATSSEYVLAPGTTAQDFARTAHRLERNRMAGSVHVTLMWAWAARVFAARGVQPRWHTPITHAWFDEYFHGHNWGPALQEPRVRHGTKFQCFLRACAVVQAGGVIWEK